MVILLFCGSLGSRIQFDGNVFAMDDITER